MKNIAYKQGSKRNWFEQNKQQQQHEKQKNLKKNGLKKLHLILSHREFTLNS